MCLDPQLLAALIRKHVREAEGVVFETGPLSIWFYHALTAEGLPTICIDACHAKAALDLAANKTGANDADSLAHLAEVGFYKEVRVKSFHSMLGRTLLAARTRLVRIGTELSNQVRSLMKTFRLVVPPASGSKFERQVEALLADNADPGRIIRPQLEAWHAVRLRAAELGRKLLADARRGDACQLLMTIPGVGVVTVTSFVTAIEDPTNFQRSRSVGVWVALTTRRYQSGEIDFDGHISRRSDRHLRAPLRGSDGVAGPQPVRVRSAQVGSAGLQLRERLGFKRVAVAVAPKLPVIMHSMLITGEPFKETRATA